MFWTVEKLKRNLPDLAAAAVRATQPVANVHTIPAPGPVAASAMAAPPADDAPWQPLAVGERWGAAPGDDLNSEPKMLGWGIPASGGSTHWLRASVRVPDEWRGKAVLLQLQWKDEGQSSLEVIAYHNGQALFGMDDFHRAMLLPDALHDGEHELLLRVYVPFQQPFGGLNLQLADLQVFQLAHAMRALVGAVTTYRDSDPERHALLAGINAAYNMLDMRAGLNSDQFSESIPAALQRLKEVGAGLEGGQRPTILSTGHAHLDVAWLWPLWRTRQKVAHTVATALHLMDRYPNYHFSMSQPQVFQYLKEDAPELYERMKARIAEGRFEPVGMMWLEPDCNVPSGESLVRQLLLGAQFFAEEFGSINHVVWLPDVFGYSAALPQLMRGCGINCFMTTKISWNQFNRMPCDTFRWRGIDGSEVITHFVTATEQPVKANPTEAQFYTYVGQMSAEEVFGTWNHYRQKEINDELLYIYGWGDGGGGPTYEMMEVANTLRDLPGFPRVELGRVEGFFQRLYERAWNDPRTPTWSGELYLEYHRGTYTSQGRTKQANRASELLYREAEWLNAWATVAGALSQQAKLNDGWRVLLLNQFHDILPGSSVPLVYVDSNNQYAAAQGLAKEVWCDSLTHLLRREARGEGYEGNGEGQEATATQSGSLVARHSSLTIINSLPWERTDYATIDLADGEAAPDLADMNGNALATQVIDEAGKRSALIEITTPSYSTTTLSQNSSLVTANSSLVTANSSLVTANSLLIAAKQRLENDHLRLDFDDNGEIVALYDKDYDREVALPGQTLNQLVAYEDRPLFWEAWDIDIFYEEKPYPVREIVSWRVAEEGPLRAAVEIVRRVGGSMITQRICLHRGSRRVDFITDVEWQERQTLLRALFPLNVNTTRATCEIQFGAVERPTHRNTSWDWARFEVCAHRWVDLSEGGYGVALLNDGKYGHSLLNTTVGLSLLKGAIHPDPDADRGHHRFTYSLLPHVGDWREGQVTRRAYELNVPLKTIGGGREVRGNGGNPMAQRLSPIASFLSSPTDHIIVETVKVAEDGNGLIVRLYEAHNQRGAASIVFDRPVASAVECDLLERETAAVAVEGNTVSFNVRPFEVKTLRVQL